MKKISPKDPYCHGPRLLARRHWQSSLKARVTQHWISSQANVSHGDKLTTRLDVEKVEMLPPFPCHQLEGAENKAGRKKDIINRRICGVCTKGRKPYMPAQSTQEEEMGLSLCLGLFSDLSVTTVQSALTTSDYEIHWIERKMMLKGKTVARKLQSSTSHRVRLCLKTIKKWRKVLW